MERRFSANLGSHSAYHSHGSFPSAILLARPRPFESDLGTDEMLTMSVRAMDRLIVLAIETGVRFERQDIDGDPVAWMYAPRSLFGGEAAVDACRGQVAFVQAMELHSSGRHLDCLPDSVRSQGDLYARQDFLISPGEGRTCHAAKSKAAPRQRHLFTTTLVDLDGETTLHVFHATMAPNASAVQSLLSARYGFRLASLARTRRGFDPSDPIVVALVSEAVSDTLEQVASDPSNPLGDGLDIQFEARFAD